MRIVSDKVLENNTNLVMIADIVAEELLGIPLHQLVDVDNINNDSYAIVRNHIKAQDKGLPKLKAEIRDLKREVEIWKGIYDKAVSDNEELETAYSEEATQRLENMETTYEEELRGLKRKVMELETLIEKKTIESEAEYQNGMLLNEISDLTTKLSRKDEEYSRLQSLNDELYSKLVGTAYINVEQMKTVISSIENVSKEFAKHSNPKIVLANAEVMGDN